MNMGSAIARVLGAHGIDILYVPSQFEREVSDLVGRDGKDAQALSVGCDARFLGFFLDAVDKGDPDALGLVSDQAAEYLRTMYQVDGDVAHELADAISQAVSEHMVGVPATGAGTGRIPSDSQSVTSAWPSVPQPIDQASTGQFPEFDFGDDLFGQQPSTMPLPSDTAAGQPMRVFDANAMGTQEFTTQTVAVEVGGNGWTTPPSDTPSEPQAPTFQKQKRQVPLAAVIGAIALVGAIGVGIGFGLRPHDTKSAEPAVEEPAVDEPAEEPTEEPAEEEVDRGKQLALQKAKESLEYSNFSYDGLVKDLMEYGSFTEEEARYAADNCGADWDEQALERAKSKLKYSAYSYSGLINDLHKYDLFTEEQSTKAADNCGADWDEQALKCADDYLDSMAFSEKGLKSQLEYEGFTSDQVKKAMEHVDVDWNEQAVLKAKEYMSWSDMSKEELIDQLEFEGFTSEQAKYGADQYFGS